MAPVVACSLAPRARSLRAGRARPNLAVSVSSVLFLLSATLTACWSSTMSAMGRMPMAGGWTMSMTWMRQPGQTWFGAGATFLGMWIVMMVAMMLPAHGRFILDWPEARRRYLGIVGAGYLGVWAIIGAVLYPSGVAWSALAMRIPTLSAGAPATAGVVALLAGLVEITPWKARRLALCHARDNRLGSLDAASAWRDGLRLGRQCALACGNLMVVAVVSGVMDLGPMAAVATAITLERLAPADARRRQAIAALVIGSGLLRLARVVGLA